MNYLFWLSTIFLFHFEAIPVKGKCYQGYIFDENHFVMISIPQEKSRYTPTEKDVLKAEALLRSKLQICNKLRSNQIDKCPVIHRNLRKYKRQYVGFINSKGEKVLWINFIWKKNTANLSLQEDIITVFDGCSYYWNIKINISTGELFDLSVNGLG